MKEITAQVGKALAEHSQVKDMGSTSLGILHMKKIMLPL